MSRVFCSDLSQRSVSGEPILGTAHYANGFVLISWPKKHWERQQFKSKQMPNSLVEELKLIQRTKKYFVRFIYKTEFDHSRIRVYLMPENIYADFRSCDDLEESIRSFRTGGDSFAIIDEHPWCENTDQLFICCTNGVRDRCCAKYGFSVVKELDRLRQSGQHNLNVWQSTHLTGDRFAATGIFFPSGDMYGWLRKNNVEDLLHAYANNAPSNLFRGNSFLEERDQIVYGVLRRHLYSSKLQISNTSIGLFWDDQDDKILRARVHMHDGAGARFGSGTIVLERKIFNVYADCSDYDYGKTMDFSRYVISDVKWN